MTNDNQLQIYEKKIKQQIFNTKKGASLSPNLFVNLKSNTMKNTVQRYIF
jgi:hypothetical protein